MALILRTAAATYAEPGESAGGRAGEEGSEEEEARGKRRARGDRANEDGSRMGHGGEGDGDGGGDGRNGFGGEGENGQGSSSSSSSNGTASGQPNPSTAPSAAYLTVVEDEAIRALAVAADGDARVALTALELAIGAAPFMEADEEDQSETGEVQEGGAGRGGDGQEGVGGVGGVGGREEERSAAAEGGEQGMHFGEGEISTATTNGGVSHSHSHLHPQPQLQLQKRPRPCRRPRRRRPVDVTMVRAALQKKTMYDRDGDAHYDLISAVHTSMRGGDPDAALYYTACMLQGGEDPRYDNERNGREKKQIAFPPLLPLSPSPPSPISPPLTLSPTFVSPSSSLTLSFPSGTFVSRTLPYYPLLLLPSSPPPLVASLTLQVHHSSTHPLCSRRRWAC